MRGKHNKINRLIPTTLSLTHTVAPERSWSGGHRLWINMICPQSAGNMFFVPATFWLYV